MNRIIIVLIAIVYNMDLNAQVEVIEVTKEPLKEFKKGVYYTYAGLRKFEGTWVYKNNSEEFTIKIKNYKTYYEKVDGIYMDNVSGNYCYKVNEELIDCDINREDFFITFGTQLSRDTPRRHAPAPASLPRPRVRTLCRHHSCTTGNDALLATPFPLALLAPG